jgi:hypothetical protein
MAYTFVKSTDIVEEGGQIEIALVNPELLDGTIVPFQIFGTGVNLDDFEDLLSFSGFFTMANGIGIITLKISADFTSETPEAVNLILTNLSLGGGTGTSFVIADTSKTPSNVTPAAFIVTANRPIAEEGDDVIFTIRATGLPSGLGTVVPYTVVGIQDEDIVPESNIGLSGNLIFNNRDGAVFSTELILPLFEDFTDEGIETIVLLVNPPFPFTLEVTTSVQVLDTSIDTLPKIRLDRSPIVIFEDGELDITAETPQLVRITLVTENIPDGFAPAYKLAPVANAAVTLRDFQRIGSVSNFSGIQRLSDFESIFPPTVGGQSNIFIVAAEDNILEGSEQFIVYLPEYDIVTAPITIFDTTTIEEPRPIEIGVVEVRTTKNIRNPPAFTPEDGFEPAPLIYYDEEVKTANVTFSALGKDVSKWLGFRGLLSSVAVIQGRSPLADPSSAVYYQPFSYVIRTKQSIEKWTSTIKDLVHPAGLASFGEINIDTELNDVPAIMTSNIGTLRISASLALTADSTDTRLRINNTTYESNLASIPLLTDLTFRTTELL